MRKLRLNRKPLLLTLAVLVVGGGVLAYSVVNNNNSSLASPNATAPKKQADTPRQINYGPPTAQEKAAGNANKDAAINRQNINNNSPSSPNSNKKSVTPIITSSSQSGSTITINGFVSGIVENGGTCTATLVN